MAERQSPGWLMLFRDCGKAKVFIFICVVTLVLSGNYLFAVEQKAASAVEHYRVFSLKHISAEQGKKYLADAGVGTVSRLPGVEALLVTAQPEELIKASAILGLVDTEEPFYIKAIFPALEVTKFPSNEQIAAKVGDISIGTFSYPPIGTAKTKAIIDVHKDKVIVVAPAEQIEKVISAVEQLKSKEVQALPAAEPNKSVEVEEAGETEIEKTTEAELKRAEDELKRIASETADQADSSAADIEDYEPNDLFDELIDSLAETEPVAETNEPVLHKEGRTQTEAAAVEEQAQQQNQPKAAAPALDEKAEAQVPEENDLSESPADLEQTEKPASHPAEETQEPNLTADESSETEADADEQESGLIIERVPRVRSYEPAPITNGNEMLELDLPERLNVIDLVDLVGKYLQLDYMYDETQIRGEVSLKLQGPIKVKDLYPLLESVLKFRGFVMTRKGNLVTIVPAAEVLGIDPILHPEAGNVQFGDVVITRVFRLKYIDTASAQNLLTSMRLGTSISPIPETGTLIITEYAYRMARVEELLEMVDQPGSPKEFRFRQLKYTMAATLAPKIKTLAEQLGTVSVTVAAPTPTQPPTRRTRGRRRTAPTPTTPAAQSAAKTAVYLDADERTNRVLMIGLEDELDVVEDLIDALDVEQQDLRSLRLYEIQHVGAEEVVKKLGELGIIGASTTSGRITAGARTVPRREGTPAPATPATASETEPLAEAPQVVVIESTNSLLVNATPEQHIQIATIISFVDSATLEQAIPYVIYSLENQDPEDLAEILQRFIQETVKDKEGKIQQTIKKTEEDITIVPDKNTFSILVYASKKNQEWIGSLIKQLDKRRPQVLIDVMLVSITEDDSFTYDLQMVSKLPEMVAGGGMQKLIPLLQPFPGNTVKELTSYPGTTGGQGFYADNHIQALLALMQKKGYGRILSRPKILVNDNEEGHIDTTTTLYVARITNQYLPNTVTTGVVSNTAVTSTTFDQYPSGIQLDITPHISEGSLLRLEVQVSQSSQPAPAGGIGADQPPPTKSENNVNTVVTVPDNSTIILGGIIQLTQNKNNNKVPFFGDIPIIGGLFRNISNTNNQAKLYIFVKANILRPDDTAAGLADLQRISDRNRAAVEGFEKKFQEHQDWPGIKPEPVEPLHILESE